MISTAPPPLAARDRRLCLVVVLASAAVIAAALAARLVAAIAPVWDDAYMFFRYAENIVRDGRIAWNPGGDPTWGTTSIVYLAVVLVARGAGVADPLRVLLVSSLACGVVLTWLLVRVARAAAGGGTSRLPEIAFVGFVLAFQARPLSAHLLSGMDTTFAASWLAVYVLLAYRHRRIDSTASAVLLGLFGGFALFARPELLVFSAALPVSMLLLARDRNGRRTALVAGVTTLVVALSGTAWGAAYFGAPLPLSFYVKAAGVYGETMRRTYQGVGLREWVIFAVSNLPCLAATAFGGVVWWRGRERADVRIEAGLLAALVAYGSFQAFLVTPIMFYEQRFHYPVLAALVAVGYRGWVALGRRRARVARVATIAATCLLLWPAARRTFDIVGSLRASGGRSAPLTLRESYRASADNWFALDRLAALPDDLVIATTEVGHPGALCLRQTIVDLAGLNDSDLAREGLSADRIFRRRPPDWIYLPHEDYREFVRMLEADPFFAAHYDLYRRDALGTAAVHVYGRIEAKPYWLEVAILRDGRHAEALRAIVTDGGRR